MGEPKRVWVRHAVLREAYDAYCKEFRSTHPSVNPNTPLSQRGLKSRHLQGLFAAKGAKFITPQEPGQVLRQTLQSFLDVVAKGRDLKDFIDTEKEAEEKAAKTPAVDSERPTPRAAKTAAWTPGPPKYLRDGFVRLDILPQSGGACFPLEISGGLSTLYVKIPEGDGTPQLPADVRIKAAELVPMSKTLQPVKDTILGASPETETKNFSYDGVRWNLKNPREDNFNPLEQACLCEMRVVAGGPHQLELLLRCRETDLEIDFRSAPQDVSATDLAILRRLLQKLGAEDPDADYVELARASISSKGSA